MATTVRFEWKSAGFRAILQSPGVGGVLMHAGNSIAKASGRDCSVHLWPGNYGGGRTICSVTTSSRDDGDLALLRAV